VIKYSNLHIINGRTYKQFVHVKSHSSYKRQNDVGIRVELPDNEVLEFKTLEISKTGLPIRHLSGKLVIETLIATDFTADLFNSGGKIFIDTLIVDVDGSKFDKNYNNYHMDALGQFFSTKHTNVNDVIINNIQARIRGKNTQGFMLSEAYNDYSHFRIGEGKVQIEMDYEYTLNAIQLRDSFINVGDNNIIIKNRKNSKFGSSNVEIKAYSSQNIITDFKANLIK